MSSVQTCYDNQSRVLKPEIMFSVFFCFINKTIKKGNLWKVSTGKTFEIWSSIRYSHQKRYDFLMNFLDLLKRSIIANDYTDFSFFQARKPIFSDINFQFSSTKEIVNEKFCYRFTAIILLCLRFIDYS